MTSWPSAREGRPVRLPPGGGSAGQKRGEEVHKGAEAFCDVRWEWRGDDPIVGSFVEVIGKRGDAPPGGRDGGRTGWGTLRLLWHCADRM